MQLVSLVSIAVLLIVIIDAEMYAFSAKLQAA
jgi:hypothetical protein